eukprot:7951229-Ditylum_brightwellii.AAC.1
MEQLLEERQELEEEWKREEKAVDKVSMEQKEEELVSSMKQELMDLILPQARMIVMEEIAKEEQSKK